MLPVVFVRERRAFYKHVPISWTRIVMITILVTPRNMMLKPEPILFAVTNSIPQQELIFEKEAAVRPEDGDANTLGK